MVKLSDFFINSIDDRDSDLHKFVRDDCDARTFTNNLWERTSDYLDKDLQTNARSQFHNSFWEMYLVATLLEYDFPVVTRENRRSTKKIGSPDVQVGNVIAWFEAITVSAGSNLDEVSELNPKSKVAKDVPQDKIKMRLTHAIQCKNKTHQTYIRNEVVKEGEPFIIALNASQIPHTLIELSIPWIVKALFGIGHEVLQFDRNTKEVEDQYHNYQGFAKKENGTQIPMNFFEEPDSRGISAILYSTANVFAYRKLGSDFVVVHNPQATAPIRKGFLKVGTEYWVEEDQLFHQDHNKEL